MCYFITIAVREAVARGVTLAHSGEGMLIERTGNASALAAARSGRQPLLVTGGGCSCAWYRPPASARATKDRARARAKYARLGWSRAKIDRALASMRRPSLPDDGLHPVIVELVRAIALEHGEVGVWVHDFRGRAAAEEYAIVACERCTVAELQTRAAALGTDIVLEVAAGG